MMESDNRLLSILKVTEWLDCSRPTVYKLIYEGKLKTVRIGKRGIRVTKDSYDKYVEENTIIPDDFHTE
jgi:excisionase family DNA binding protein